jgi:hypothetical protein
MKRILILLFGVAVAIISVSATAQTKIKASDIIKQIDAGRAVDYSNVEIEGDLDLTDLQNRRHERGSGSSLTDLFNDNSVFESQVEVSMRFTNCTFLGDVLAYYHIERENETYIAHFEKDAVFTNCIFKRASEFKYSEFDGLAAFAGCTFYESANFKYTEFSSGPTFANARFEGGADFKYTEFPRETTFERAIFRGLANFKYSKFRSPLNLEGISFKGTEDFKYTRIDGESFTSYLLNN